MEALSASESHFQTFPEKIIKKFGFFEENSTFGLKSYNEIGDSTLKQNFYVLKP